MIPNPNQSTNSSVTALLKSFCSFLRNVAVDRSKHRVSVNINFQNYLSGERSLIKSGPQTSDSGGRCTSAVLSGARARVACRADRPRLILSRISRGRRPTVKFDGSPSRVSERERVTNEAPSSASRLPVLAEQTRRVPFVIELIADGLFLLLVGGAHSDEVKSPAPPMRCNAAFGQTIPIL